MKTLKQIIKETVAQPKSPDEKRFKELHTKNVNVKDYGSKASDDATKKYAKKKPRPADYTDGSDEMVYDISYESVDLDDFLVIDEDMLEEAIDDLSEEQLDELLKTAAKAVGAGTVGAKAVKSYADKAKKKVSSTFKKAKKQASEEVDLDEVTDQERLSARKVQRDAQTARHGIKRKPGESLAAYIARSQKRKKKMKEDAWEEIPMMTRQLKFIAYATQEIAQYLNECDEQCVDPEEWFQNKLARIHGDMKSLYAYSKGDEHMNPMTGMYEETDLNEDVMKDLEKIANSKSRGEVKFKDGDTMKVDMQTANILLKLHGALNDKNKQTFANAVSKDETGFMKMVDFAWSKVK